MIKYIHKGFRKTGVSFRRWHFYKKIVSSKWYIPVNNHTQIILNASLNKTICLQWIHILTFQEMTTSRKCYPRAKKVFASTTEPHYIPDMLYINWSTNNWFVLNKRASIRLEKVYIYIYIYIYMRYET